MAIESEVQRFRSFAERYVVARAQHFEKLNEKHDAWATVEDAKQIYLHIGSVADRQFADPSQPAAQAAPVLPRRTIHGGLTSHDMAVLEARARALQAVNSQPPRKRWFSRAPR